MVVFEEILRDYQTYDRLQILEGKFHDKRKDIQRTTNHTKRIIGK